MRRLLHLIPILLLCISGPAAAVKLKIATLSPEGTNWMTQMRSAGAQIERETDGRVRLQFYPGGVMGDYKAMLRKMRIGQLHGCAVTGGALAALVPDAIIYRLPFLFREPAEVDHLRAHIDQRIIDQLEHQGMISFGFVSSGFTYLMSSREVGNLEQVQTRKLWAPEGDRVSDAVFGSLQISPISLPLTDVLTGLQTGLVDSVVAPPTGAIAMQWHTQTNYLLDMPLTFSYGSLIITQKAMNMLSVADREAVARIFTEATAKLDRENREGNAQAKAALKNQGMVFLQPSPTERARLEQKVEPAMGELGESGFFTPGLVREARELIKRLRNDRKTAVP
jgi:TRAP-type C4-dicarboxylate transport system substrate-binding protein